MRRWLLALCLLLVSPLLRGESEPLVVLEHGQITVLRDKSKQLTLAQARAEQAEGQFKPLVGKLGLGFSPDWLDSRLPRIKPEGRRHSPPATCTR